MLIAALTAYTIVALAYLLVTMSGDPPRRRSRLADEWQDRLLLAAVAVAASAAWALLVPLYAKGWLGSEQARQVHLRVNSHVTGLRRRVRRLGELRGAAH